jgi:hypothetical protein
LPILQPRAFNYWAIACYEGDYYRRIFTVTATLRPT